MAEIDKIPSLWIKLLLITLWLLHGSRLSELETRGLSLEGIDQIFFKSKNILQPGWVAKKLLKGEHTHAQDEKVIGDWGIGTAGH